ncbi:MAG: hypothetical protein Q8S36_06125 [Sulfuricurvum sp.]|jgi:hypothetical protein|nr:hypothetical protein [Sulfuricurvum sp.]
MSTTKTISILFYKGKGTIFEKLIRWWTKSPYCHTEFLRSDGSCHSNDRLTQLSRIARFELASDDWARRDIELPCEIVDRVEQRQLAKIGTHYDWKGIVFSQFFPFGWHAPDKWFCSKSNADDLLYAYKLMARTKNPLFTPFLEMLKPLAYYPPHELSPHDLFQLMPANL